MLRQSPYPKPIPAMLTQPSPVIVTVSMEIPPSSSSMKQCHNVGVSSMWQNQVWHRGNVSSQRNSTSIRISKGKGRRVANEWPLLGWYAYLAAHRNEQHCNSHQQQPWEEVCARAHTQMPQHALKQLPWCNEQRGRCRELLEIPATPSPHLSHIMPQSSPYFGLAASSITPASELHYEGFLPGIEAETMARPFVGCLLYQRGCHSISIHGHMLEYLKYRIGLFAIF